MVRAAAALAVDRRDPARADGRLGVLRTRQISGELWFDEAIAIGIAQHSLGDLPGLVRNSGGSPLYYVLLHFWIDAVGSASTDVHWLSGLIALLTIPAAMWVGWSLGGRRAGIFAAILFAFSSYMTQFSQEAQPYELLVLLSLLTTAGFLHGFVYRRRRYLVLFAVGLEAMLYTQVTAGLYAFGAVCALGVVYWWAPTGAARASCATRRSASARWRCSTCHGCRRRSTRSATPPRPGITRRSPAPPCRADHWRRPRRRHAAGGAVVGCVPMLVAARRRSARR